MICNIATYTCRSGSDWATRTHSHCPGLSVCTAIISMIYYVVLYLTKSRCHSISIIGVIINNYMVPILRIFILTSRGLTRSLKHAQSCCAIHLVYTIIIFPNCSVVFVHKITCHCVSIMSVIIIQHILSHTSLTLGLMFWYLHVWACVYIYVCMRVHGYICIWVYMSVCPCTCVCSCVYVYIYVYLYMYNCLK